MRVTERFFVGLEKRLSGPCDPVQVAKTVTTSPTCTFISEHSQR